MAITTGDPLWPGTGVFPGSSVYPGQGTEPVAQVFYNLRDSSLDPPAWFELISDRVRDFATSRGRDNELQEFDSGTAIVTLNNRDRAFDPSYASSPYSPNVRPMNGIWLREQFNGATNSVFKGYVEALQQDFPAPGMSEAVCTVRASDEMKTLARKKLPVTDPPRDSYAEVVQY